MSGIDPALLIRFQNHLKLTGYHAKTVDAMMRHVFEFSDFLGSTPLLSIRDELILEFKSRLDERPRQTGEGQLSASTRVHILRSVKIFMAWLLDEPGFRHMDRRIPDRFKPPRALARQAQVPGNRFVPSQMDLLNVLKAMPSRTYDEKRRRAVFAFIVLTGIRDGALIGFRMKNIDIDQKSIWQDPRVMDTKFSKLISTPWFPVDVMFEDAVIEWVGVIKSITADDRAFLFPSQISHDPKNLSRFWFTRWTSAAPIRSIFRDACAQAGLPYFNPHSVRKAHGTAAGEWAFSVGELLSISDALGHENIETTLKSYRKPDHAESLAHFSRMRERARNPSTRDAQKLFDGLSKDSQNAVITLMRNLQGG